MCYLKPRNGPRGVDINSSLKLTQVLWNPYLQLPFLFDTPLIFWALLELFRSRELFANSISVYALWGKTTVSPSAAYFLFVTRRCVEEEEDVPACMIRSDLEAIQSFPSPKASRAHNAPTISSASINSSQVKNGRHTPASRVCLRSDIYENCSTWSASRLYTT